MQDANVGEEFTNVKALAHSLLPQCLPMEFSWSLLFAQGDDEEPKILLLRDRGRPIALSLERDAQETRHCVCFDKCGSGRQCVSSLSDWEKLLNPSIARASKFTSHS